MLFASLFQKASQPSAAQAVQGHDFPPPPLGSSQWVLFSLFPCVGASQAREFQIATTTTPRKTVQTTFRTVICIFFHKILQISCFLKCVLHVFLHGNLHSCRHKNVPKHHLLQCLQFPCLPKPCYLHCFLQFFHVPMPLASSNICTKKSFKKHYFFTVFFTMFFRQKHRNLHVFRHKVGPKHWFLQCFQCSGIQKTFQKYRDLQCFFMFVRSSIAGKPTKMKPKITFQYPLKLRHPKNRRKNLAKILVSVRKPLMAPPS